MIKRCEAPAHLDERATRDEPIGLGRDQRRLSPGVEDSEQFTLGCRHEQ